VKLFNYFNDCIAILVKTDSNFFFAAFIEPPKVPQPANLIENGALVPMQ
jgi:hypothetical protein